MMSNENPLPPSDKVLEAMIKYSKMANRYPDQGLVVRTKIAEINGVDGPDNVMIGNGSSEVYDNIFRMFIVPEQDEVIQHTPCFGIYRLRGTLLGAKMVSVPMIYKDKLPALRPGRDPECHHRQDQDHRGRQPEQPDRQLHGAGALCPHRRDGHPVRDR